MTSPGNAPVGGDAGRRGRVTQQGRKGACDGAAPGRPTRDPSAAGLRDPEADRSRRARVKVESSKPQGASMNLTHILVDFENVQPSALDIGLVPGAGVRLAIFRGPGQMKYSADVAEAWQPLGPNVTFIRCAKAGRNAVDMHIAFYLGELVAKQEQAEAGQGARFFIVSRDTDFDPLLMHIRSQGFEAARVASIKAALNGGAPEKPEPRAAK